MILARKIKGSSIKSFWNSESSILSRAPLEIGDFVAITKTGREFAGIITKLRKDPDSNGKNTILLHNGHFLTHRDDDVFFQIPGYAHTKVANGNLLNTTGSSIPINYAKIGGDLYKSALILMQSKILELRKIHDKYALEEDVDTISVQDISRNIFKSDKLEPAQLLAVQIFLMKEYTHFIPDSTSLTEYGKFEIRPQNEVNLINQVKELVRSNNQKFIDFLKKSELIIKYMRSLTIDNSIKLSFNKDENLPEFTSDDQLFINFVKTFILRSRYYHDTDVFIAAILKPLKLYDGPLDKECATIFLKEIGVWAPWENLQVYESTLKLNGHGVSRQSDKQFELATQFAEKLINSKPHNSMINSNNNNSKRKSKKTIIKTMIDKLSSEDFYPYDICENIRHDFGNLPVYTIDDPTAHELDDGISIERVSKSSSLDGSDVSSTWIHVHVADPSAYIPPHHALSNIAFSRVQSVYFPERNYPMIPSVMNEKRFSLGADSGKTGNYVMTFSLRIDDNGNILDYKIRPGIVRKIYTLHYDDVDDLLVWDYVPASKDDIEFVQQQQHYHPYPATLTKIKKKPPSPQLQKDLIDLQKISVFHMHNRVKAGSYTQYNLQSSIQLSPKNLPVTTVNPNYPIVFSGVPSIHVSLDKGNFSPSRMMVAEFMIMAGRVASQYCREHKIPILYRLQNPPDSSAIEELLSNIDMKTGSIPFSSINKIRSTIKRVELTTEYGPHWALGIKDGYIKVTSPLRRYVDLLAHWQIKASLLKSPYPFQNDILIDYSRHIRKQEREISRQSQKSSKFWVLTLLNRMINLNILPELTGLVIEKGESDSKLVLLREFGIRGRLIESENSEVGDVIKLKIKEINVERLGLVLTPTI
nr:3340_t:CDS:2 [Entrophospora candida]